jgi:D-alanyl-D-alanine carboxypeptidase/D-alanyl-D-alanine-endopeptidase (penicillin-binding protein 4)
MVDHNEYRGDEEFLADPLLADGDVFRAVLAGAGIVVGAPTRSGVAPEPSTVVASLTSPTVPELVQSMLRNSDNEIAELLTREAGRYTTGQGTTAAGTQALEAAVAALCVPPAGPWADGSGLSRINRVSARELRDLLLAARGTAEWPTIMAALPVGGVSGTLRNRFQGTAAEGNVRAKTGYLADAVALSGTLVTRGGRTVFFSILAGGPDAAAGIAAIDDLVVALAEDPS